MHSSKACVSYDSILYSIDYIHYFSLQKRDIAPEVMPDFVDNNSAPGTVLSTY